jgi:hypothetical protein
VTVAASSWITQSKKPDGSLSVCESLYLNWDVGDDHVMIDGLISVRDLRELVDYIEHNREGGKS